MFLNQKELNTAIYGYQVDQISDGDTSIMAFAIEAAIEEVKSYLSNNYDTKAVFETVEDKRNPLILQITKTITLWHFVQLCNAEIVYDQVKDRYDRAIDFLKKIMKGDLSLDLPVKLYKTDTTATKNNSYGSRKKFNHSEK